MACRVPCTAVGSSAGMVTTHDLDIVVRALTGQPPSAEDMTAVQHLLGIVCQDCS